MLNRRGGQADFVKVLDFGLVHEINPEKPQLEHSMSGTPLYLSPEAIQSPSLIDACSDLYAVGAVAYFLATGQTVFDADSVVELLQKHITESPVPPNERPGIQISAELEHVILSCLDKSRARRPQTARDLATSLMRCPHANEWSLADADAWWSAHERRRAAQAAGGMGFEAPNAGPHARTTYQATGLKTKPSSNVELEQTFILKNE